MKLLLLLMYMVVTTNAARPVIRAPLDIISLDDITPEERRQLAEFEEKLRLKRSGAGSGDILKVFKNAIGQTIKKKIGQVAKASASASGAFSRTSSSSGGGEYYHHHHPDYEHDVPESYDHKSFDWWSLKKSIFNTLLQAVKAIKGGVIAVKGQLIKGSGKLLSVKGNLISAKGDAISSLGKNIATSAVLVPFGSHGHTGHGDYGTSGSYGEPSAPEDVYHGAPSAPGPEYHHPPPPHYPSHHHHHHDAVDHQHSGLLILKKIQRTNNDHHHQPSASHAYSAVKPTGPSSSTFISKFFAASSSLDPHKPEPFGNTASADTHHPQEGHQPPLPTSPGVESHGESLEPPSTSYGVPFEQAPNYLDQNLDDYAASDTKNHPKTVPKPQATAATQDNDPGKDYITGLPKLTPSAAPIADPYPNPTNVNQLQDNSQQQNPLQLKLNSSPPSQINEALSTYQTAISQQTNVQYPTLGGPTLGTDYYNDVANFPNIADYPGGFPANSFNQNNPINVPDSTNQNSNLFNAFSSPLSTQNANQVASQNQNSNLVNNFPNSVNSFDQNSNLIGFPHLDAVAGTFSQDPKQNPFGQRPQPFKLVPSPSPYLETPKETYFLPTPSANDQTPSLTKPNHTKRRTKRPSSSKAPRPGTKQNYDVVKSVSYQLGPNGPKRLT